MAITKVSKMARSIVCGNIVPNPTLKFAPCGRWDAPSARPLAAR